MGKRFSAPGAHSASCTMGTGSFPGVKSGRGVTLTPHPLLLPWSRNSRAIPLLPLWAVPPVQSLSACTRVHFFFLPSVVEYDATSRSNRIRTLRSNAVASYSISTGHTESRHRFITQTNGMLAYSVATTSKPAQPQFLSWCVSQTAYRFHGYLNSHDRYAITA